MFTYIAGALLIFDGVKGELPNAKITLAIILGVLVFTFLGMHIMSIVNNHPII